jgi:WD40 repeat protein
VDAQLIGERPPWLVRIRSGQGEIVGAGFLIGQGHIVTCAHVVNEALERNVEDATLPQDEVLLDFPLLVHTEERRSRVTPEGWVPIDPDGQGDIAILSLAEGPPYGVEPAPIAAMRSLRGHRCWTLGFPPGHDRGVWAEGHLMGSVGGGWVQLDSLRVTGRAVEQGFSGAPVWDDQLQAVVGMVVGQDRHPHAKTAFIIPSDVLATAWPSLGPMTNDRELPGQLSNVPPLPPNFVRRPHNLSALKHSLLDGLDQSSSDHRKIGLVGVSGMGGVGKSVLAASLAYDTDVRRAFPDGVIWIELGQDPLLTERQSQLAAATGEAGPPFADVQRGRARLSELLANKACLIIVDNVWRSRHLSAFDAVGPRCRLVFTTRDAEIARTSGALKQEVGLLSDEEALVLLAQWADEPVNSLPVEAHAVANECGKLALALAMAGAMVRERPERWSYVLRQLQNADLDRIRAEFPHYPHPTVLMTVAVSIDDLSERESRLYRQLVVFRDHGPVPPAAIHVLWESEGIDKDDAEYFLDLYVDRSLARRDEANHISLHDLQMDYLYHETSSSDMGLLHNQLLRSYEARCSNGWPTGPNDGYFVERVGHHLALAGRAAELRQLLLDYRWIERKVMAASVGSLMSDYDLLKDRELGLIQDALRLSTHALIQRPEELPGQLMGRLSGKEASSTQDLVKVAQAGRSRPWLCPIKASLESPGGPLVRTLRIPTKSFEAMDITPDGRWAVASIHDGTFRVWDLESGLEDRVLRPPGIVLSGCSSLFVTNGGRRAVTGGFDGRIRVWDLESGLQLREVQGATGLFFALAVSTDGRRAATGTDDGTLWIWDLEDGHEMAVLRTDDLNPISAVALTYDGDAIFSGTVEGVVRYWRISNNHDVYQVGTVHSSVMALATTPDSRYIAVGGLNGMLSCWDLRRSKRLWRVRAHTGKISSLVPMPDGRRIVSVPKMGKPSVWSIEDGAPLLTLGSHGGAVTALVAAQWTHEVVSTATDGMLRIWNLNRAEPSASVGSHAGAINALVMVPNVHRCLSASDDGMIKVWDADVGEELNALYNRPSIGPIQALAVTPYGDLAVSGEGSNIQLWNLITSLAIGQAQPLSSQVNVLTFLPRSYAFVCGLNDGSLSFCEIRKLEDYLKQDLVERAPQGEVAQKLLGKSPSPVVVREIGVRRPDEISPVRAVAVSPDGRKIISGSEDGLLRVWALAASPSPSIFESHVVPPIEVPHAEPTTIGRHDGAVTAVAISLDGRYLVSGSEDSAVKLWDIARGEPVRSMSADTPVRTVALSPAARWIAAGFDDGTLRVWDRRRAQLIASFTGDSGIRACVVASDEPATFVIGEATGRVHTLRLIENSEH